MVPQQQWYIDLNTSALHYYDTEKLGTFDLFVQKSPQSIGIYLVIFGKMHQMYAIIIFKSHTFSTFRQLPSNKPNS